VSARPIASLACRAASPADAGLRDFVRSRSLADLAADPLWMLDHLISGPSAVLDLWAGLERTAVAIVADAVENAANAAELVVLAATPGSLDPAAVEAMLTAAERVAMAGPRANLEVALPPALAFAEALLRLRGYDDAYGMFDMVTPLGEVVSPAALPRGFRWEDLSAPTVDRFYEAVRLAFAEVPGVSLPDVETFRARNLSHRPPVRLLFSGGDLAGFARVKGGAGEPGWVDLVGRAPRFRGRGLGPHLLDEALRLLADLGAVEARLQVVSRNPRAIALYRSRGFTLAREQLVMTRRL
jgi:GNAT superfamily N-acetyltransferase